MLSQDDLLRQLEANLDLMKNTQAALEKLLDALEHHEPADQDEAFQPTPEDWEEYSCYLDRLDQDREYQAMLTPVFQDWLERSDLPEDD